MGEEVRYFGWHAPKMHNQVSGLPRVCNCPFRNLLSSQAETVPGCMVYWLAVETCRRALAPYEVQVVAPATA